MTKICRARINRRSLYAYAVLFALVIGYDLSNLAAAAQAHTAAHGDKSSTDSSKGDFKFEVVSLRPVAANAFTNDIISGITPDGYTARVPVRGFIMLAYAPEEFPATLLPDGATRISNTPNWINDVYVLNARVAESDRKAWTNQSSRHELLTFALREILKERFKLILHEQPTEVPGLRLVTTRKGVKLKATPPGFVFPPGGSLQSGGVVVGEGPTRRHYYGAAMEDLAAWLSLTTLRPVQDNTGLTGRYEFMIQRISDPANDYNGRLDNWPIGQLGLALKPGKVAGRTLIIDHIEKPGEN